MDWLDVLRQAADPNTSAEELMRLWEEAPTIGRPSYADWQNCGLPVRKAIARNPNAPIGLLVRATSTAPEAVLENPALALFLLEDPACCLFDDTALARLVRVPTCPESILRVVVERNVDTFTYMVAAHPAAPAHLLTQLSEHPKALVRGGVAQNPRTPPEVLDRLADDVMPGVRRGVYANPSAWPTTHSRIAQRGLDLLQVDRS